MLFQLICFLAISTAIISAEWTYDNIQDWTMCQCSICDYQHTVHLGFNSDESYPIQMNLNATSTNWNKQNIYGSWVAGSFTICLGRDFRYNECGCLTFTESITSLDLQAVLGESCINTGNIIATVYCGGAYGTLNLNGYVRWQENIPPTPLPSQVPTPLPTNTPTNNLLPPPGVYIPPITTPTEVPTIEPTLTHYPTIQPTAISSITTSNVVSFWDNTVDKVLFGCGMIFIVIVLVFIIRWCRSTYKPIEKSDPTNQI